MENVPEIMAWLAMIEAITDTTNIGQYNGSVYNAVPSNWLENYGNNEKLTHKEIHQPGIDLKKVSETRPLCFLRKAACPTYAAMRAGYVTAHMLI